MDKLSIRNLIIRVAAAAVVGTIGYTVTDRTAVAIDRKLSKGLPVPQLDR